MQFSEIGGTYGAQRQLQLQRIDAGPEDLSLEIKLNAAIDRLPPGPEREDARFAGRVFLLADACQTGGRDSHGGLLAVRTEVGRISRPGFP